MNYVKIILLTSLCLFSSCSSSRFLNKQPEPFTQADNQESIKTVAGQANPEQIVSNSQSAAPISDNPQEVIEYYLPDQRGIEPGMQTSSAPDTMQAQAISPFKNTPVTLPVPILSPLPEKTKKEIPLKKDNNTNKTSSKDIAKKDTVPLKKNSRTDQPTNDNDAKVVDTTKSTKNTPLPNTVKNTLPPDTLVKPVNKTVENPNENPTVEKSIEKSLEKATKKQSLLARSGDELNIRLDKRGWIFLGHNNQDIKDGLPLTNREHGNNFTQFSFAARKIGTYQLLFVFQDNTQGTQEKNVYDVQVVSAEEFNNALASLNGKSDISLTAAIDSANGHSSEYISWLVQTEKYEEALTELLKNYEENVPYLNEQIANIYWQMHKPEMALKYWLKNVTKPLIKNNTANDTYTEKAIAGVVKSAIKTNNDALFLKYLNSLFAIKSFPINEELLSAARYCEAKQDYATAYDILNRWLTSNVYSDSTDEALFLLGKLYEESTDYKDYRKAKKMYERVYQEYPESLFARPAYERVAYLNQHYFYIR